jgi:hypothetical protein
MKYIKAAAVLIIVIGVAALLYWQFGLQPQLAQARVATPYGAKMVCSCRFIADRPMESCQQDFTEDVSAVTFTEEGNTVHASVLGGWISAEARYEDGLGCTLVKPD